MSLKTFCDATVSILNIFDQFQKNVRYFAWSRCVLNIKSLSLAVLHELVTQKWSKKKIRQFHLISLNFIFIV